MKCGRKSALGFALMAAIFILVTLASISVYLLTISAGQLAAGTQDEQASRAYQAARAGIDWGAFQLLRNSAGVFATACSGGATSQTLSLGPIGGPAGAISYWSEVACTRIASQTEGGLPVTVYRLTVTGCNRSACGAADATYVERQLQLTVSLN